MEENGESLQELERQIRELRRELTVLEKYRSGYADLEKSLEEDRAFLDTLTGSVLEPIVILGWEGDILYANAAAFRLAGIDPSADLSKLNAFSFIASDDHLVLSDNLGRVRDRNERFITLYRFVTSTGELRWLEALGNRVAQTLSDKGARALLPARGTAPTLIAHCARCPSSTCIWASHSRR